MYKFFIGLIITFLTTQCVFADDVWINDLRKLFTSNLAVIYEINLRTFGAQDSNKNGIIDFDEGEESGNFLNAIQRLDELKQNGINTIHVMPVTPIGKTKALGTAGSLYAASDFSSLNPQLMSKQSTLSLKQQAIKFINEAHKRNLRVIIDLPSCGSYDLYLKRPELFVKDKSGQPVVPADWTDVRLFDAGNETAVNNEVYNLFKEFVDMVISIGADGIRADVATSKPALFWKKLIDYSRTKDPQFLWLAEASESWTEPISQYAVFTPYDKLLSVGFDGYYGSFFNLKNFKTGKELTNLISQTISNVSKFSDSKSVIGSFVTHDEMSPILVNGPSYSEMIIWLNATLPVNSYSTDGFDSGDSYIYLWANKDAFKTYTDDDIYFAHRGKMDIFNFSRKPGGNIEVLKNDFRFANYVKQQFKTILSLGKFTPLRTLNQSTFAYSMSNGENSIIVMGNLDYKTSVQTKVYIPKLNSEISVLPLKIDSVPKAEKGGFDVELKPGEIIVLMLNKFSIK